MPGEAAAEQGAFDGSRFDALYCILSDTAAVATGVATWTKYTFTQATSTLRQTTISPMPTVGSAATATFINYGFSADTLTMPKTGLYLISAEAIFAADAGTISRKGLSLIRGASTSPVNLSDPQMWPTSTGAQTVRPQVNGIRFFSSGETLHLRVFSDLAVNVTSAVMSAVFLG